MSSIRPLERGDLDGVAALYEQMARSGSRTPPAGLADYIGGVALDQPWADEEIPALVAEGADGAIVGFLGSNPRRVRLDGMAVRVACSGHLVAHPEHPGVGALLTRAYLRGPQTATITDGGTDLMAEIWTGLRGRVRVAESHGWYRVFRPAATVTAMLARGGRRVPRAAAALGTPLDAVTRRLPWQRLTGTAAGPAPEPTTSAEDLTVAGLLDQMGGAARRWRLYPDYDQRHLEWVFGELDAPAAVAACGPAVRRLVHDRRGRVLGWYVCLRPEGGIAQVLQIAALGPDPGPVLDDLFADAQRAGAVAVHGRLEPALAPVLRARGCLIRPTPWALVHSEDTTLLALLGSPEALLTRLDGEWWMGHHLLWREGAPA